MWFEVDTDEKLCGIFQRLLNDYNEGLENPGLLTADELLAIGLHSQSANVIGRDVIAKRDQRDFDWGQAADKIHQLQAMVMAQAASRAYPKHFRPLGGWPEKDQDADK